MFVGVIYTCREAGTVMLLQYGQMFSTKILDILAVFMLIWAANCSALNSLSLSSTLDPSRARSNVFPAFPPAVVYFFYCSFIVSLFIREQRKRDSNTLCIKKVLIPTICFFFPLLFFPFMLAYTSAHNKQVSSVFYCYSSARRKIDLSTYTFICFRCAN